MYDFRRLWAAERDERHTGATRYMRVPGATLRDLMTVGGWRDLKSVMRYQHESGAARAIVDQMSAPALEPRARRVHRKRPSAS